MHKGAQQKGIKMARYKARSAKLLDLLAAKSLGGTVNELAEFVGISRNTASAIMNGKPVASSTALTISSAFDVAPSELFEDDGGES